jgi:1,4-alpha-glucan branching enzyme
MAETLVEVSPSKNVELSQDIELLKGARHPDPYGVLGPHAVEVGGRMELSIRVFVPDAQSVFVVPKTSGDDIPSTRVDEGGFFVADVGPVGEDFRYRLRIKGRDGTVWEAEDSYRFGRQLTEFDVHLLTEGTHYKNYEKLGAHLAEIDGVTGVLFAVWAPNAERVSVVGTFNDWDGRRHLMRNLAPSGFWEVFVPGLAEGDLYKFEIRSRVDGSIRLKSDPYSFASEFRPKTASIVYGIEEHRGEDQSWLQDWRQKHNALDSPMAVYEVHLGSWMRGDNNTYLGYSDFADKLVSYVKDMGYTHIELLPILEHPFDGSWGYQPLGYFTPTNRFGRPQDFMAFVDACHRAHIGVILDWVPAHFPRDDHGLRLFDGTALYEHADPRQGEHRDWGTLIFNYDRNEVKNFLLGNALFWLEKYRLDGIRVDAVASMLYLDYSREEGDWIPNQYGGRENIGAIEFLKRFNELCHAEYPGVLTIAEESTSWPSVSRPTFVGGLGFSLKWNMGWMNDILEYFSQDSVYRKYQQQNLTFSMLYAFTENFVLPLSHDEVVHGKGSLLDHMPGDGWQKFANLRLLFGLQYAFPGKKLNFMGNEFGQGREWNCDQSLDWHLLENDSHKGVQSFVRDLNHVYTSEPALHQIDFDWEGFEWIDFADWESCIVSFIRRGKRQGDEVIVLLNFTPVPRYDYRVGVPVAGFYREILNSDSELYGGSNMGNQGGVASEKSSTHGRANSLSVTLPPLSALILKRRQG